MEALGGSVLPYADDLLNLVRKDNQTLYALDRRSGKLLHHGKIEGPHYAVGERGKAFFSEGANNDVLVLEGDHIYMRQKKFTKELKEVPVPILSSKGARDVGDHLFATAGLLDGSWYNRTFWMYAGRWPGFQLANQAPKAGQLLVIDDQTTYALRVFYHRNCHSPMFFPGEEGYLVFADKNTTRPQIYGEQGAKRPLPWLPQSAYWRVTKPAGAGGDPRRKLPGPTRRERRRENRRLCRWIRRPSVRTRGSVVPVATRRCGRTSFRCACAGWSRPGTRCSWPARWTSLRRTIRWRCSRGARRASW